MSRSRLFALVRIVAAGLGLLAVGFQLRGAIRDPEKSVTDFFSEFTTQSNIAAAIVLTVGAWLLWTNRPSGHTWDLVRGAILTYMATTGIVFEFLVSGTRETGASYYYPWASDILHKVVPIVLLIDWILAPPRTRISFREVLLWPIYPLVFCAYSLIRGSIVDWYPYNFIDPGENGGYDGVTLYVVAITFGFLVFSLAVMSIGNLMAGRRNERAPIMGATT